MGTGGCIWRVWGGEGDGRVVGWKMGFGVEWPGVTFWMLNKK